jgi:hypothetical protein
MRLRLQSVLSLFTLAVLGIGGAVAHSTGVFNVKQILCQTDQGACPDYVQAELNTHLGESLFFTDFYAVGNTITSLAPFLNRFELTKQFPNTIHIHFSTAKPAYRFVDIQGRIWIIDEVGYVVNLIEEGQPIPEHIPLITANSSFPFQPEVRDRLTSELHQNLLSLFASLKEQGLTDTQVFLLSEQEAELKLSNGKVALLTIADSTESVTRLSYLLDHFAFSSVYAEVAQIDLRFHQVILRTASSAATVQLSQ